MNDLMCKHGRYRGARCLDCQEDETQARVAAARRAAFEECARIAEGDHTHCGDNIARIIRLRKIEQKGRP